MNDRPESSAPDAPDTEVGEPERPGAPELPPARSGRFGRLPLATTAVLVVFAFIGAVALGALIRRTIDTPVAAQPSPSVATEPSPSPSTPAGSAVPSGSPVPSATAAQPADGQIAIDSIATVVTNDLRVRSKPGVSDDSKRLTPLLDAGREVFVVDGPVRASGFDWYQVQPLDDGDIVAPFGWVAAAGKDGEQWLAGDRFECPSVPTTFEAVTATPAIVQLACYGDQPLTFTARFGRTDLICPLEGGFWTIEPGWLAGEGCQDLLVYSGNPDDGFYPTLDPDLHLPDLSSSVDPKDAITVEITGHSDDPAARTCKAVRTGPGDIPYSAREISLTCRSQFVITSIRPV